MKISMLKPHPHYAKGWHDVDNARGEYLVKMGIAEKVEFGPIIYQDEKRVNESFQKDTPQQKSKRKQKR